MTEDIFGSLNDFNGLDLLLALIVVMAVIRGFDYLKSHYERKRRKELSTWLRNGRVQ